MQIVLSTKPTSWTTTVKATIDRLGALFGIVLLAPLWICIALAIAVTMGRPVLFIQNRVGKDEKIFRMFKFRTMREPPPSPPGEGITDLARTRSDAERITRLGRWLRRSSLDELPQLLNVLRGEMSLVGPRPQLAAYLPRYTPAQRQRHAVRPGMTGLAQVCGRNLLTWERKFELDVEYVHNWSLRGDLWLLLRTVSVVVSGKGVEAAGSVTPTEFRGTLDRVAVRATSDALDRQAA
ncbi:MAG: sugar transferase [Myxococcales bacterium FL481]|nr:MAG: sugar transferase [Myxococcales bacterium FL481]